MKKNSKVIRKNYASLEENDFDANLKFIYYGVSSKHGRMRIDTKRYERFFSLPSDEMKNRNTVYFRPLKKKRKEYAMSYFMDAINSSKDYWDEQKDIFMDLIKKHVDELMLTKPKTYEGAFASGVMDAEEYQLTQFMEKLKNAALAKKSTEMKIYRLQNTLYSQTISMIASHLERAMVHSMAEYGYDGDKTGRYEMYIFMDGRIKHDKKKIENLPHYKDWDGFYALWNFIKHNSPSALKTIQKYYPKMLLEEHRTIDSTSILKENKLAVEYLNINNAYFDDLWKRLEAFYTELCELCYDEPAGHCEWDYEEYFYDEVGSKIREEFKSKDNPSDLPEYL